MTLITLSDGTTTKYLSYGENGGYMADDGKFYEPFVTSRSTFKRGGDPIVRMQDGSFAIAKRVGKLFTKRELDCTIVQKKRSVSKTIHSGKCFRIGSADEFKYQVKTQKTYEKLLIEDANHTYPFIIGTVKHHVPLLLDPATLKYHGGGNVLAVYDGGQEVNFNMNADASFNLAAPLMSKDKTITIDVTDDTIVVRSVIGNPAPTDGGSKAFFSPPVPPYKVDDIWFSGTTTITIYKCIISRSTGSYNAADWELYSEYSNGSTSYDTNELISDLAAASAYALGDFYFGPSGALKMMTDANNGTYFSPNGITSIQGGLTTLAITQYGSIYLKGEVHATSGTFAGSLSAATGTFAGDLSAAGGTFNGTGLFKDANSTPTYMTIIGGVLKSTSKTTRDPIGSDVDTTTQYQMASYTYDSTNSEWLETFKIDSNSGIYINEVYAGSRGFNYSGGKALGLNTAFGIEALSTSSPGRYNTAIGENALTSVAATGGASTDGWYNTALGYGAGDSITTGKFMTAIGIGSLADATTGSNNTAIGQGAGGSSSPFNITTESNRVVLGDNNVTNAYIKVAWTVTSDERDKTDIVPLRTGIDFIMGLNPVEFKWDDRTRYEDNTPDGSKKDDHVTLGFLAQDVAELEDMLGFENDVVANTEKKEKYMLKETALIPFLVKAVQELKRKVDDLNSKKSEDAA